MFVNRGIYHQGWTAVTRHSIPWVLGEAPAIADDVRELYGPDDWTQAHDLAAENPDKLAELQRLFAIEGARGITSSPTTTGVWNASTATWPAGRSSSKATRQLMFRGMKRLSEAVSSTSEQVARGDRRGRGARGRRIRCPDRPGRAVRRLVVKIPA